ncbi:ArnT family glycosyltransferase [Tundrisphaera lichenicola]|uniref:ArnT family glycosyltransferase n=1 Tax=Tundrisphaera lichenicola TaxID=2029860 RepID=UPI003EBCE8DF
MSSRRWLIVVAILSAALHVVGMARTPLPAQDGLKFLRVARSFQTGSWVDAVRGSDQHPLYPALVALVEPVLAWPMGHGPDAWRIAAQLISALAAVALLWPLHELARRMFDDRTADLTVFLYAMLPFPAAIGHDTLADSLALSFTIGALCLGERTIRTRSWASAIGCGALAGLGFWTRPEVALVPPVVVMAAMWGWRPWRDEFALFARLLAMSAAILGFVGTYGLVKGQLSEKLSLRWSTSVGIDAMASKKAAPTLPRGLDNPRFDFSPKEESDHASLRGLPLAATGRLAREWAEGISFLLVPVVVWGVIRGRSRPGTVEGRRLVLVYLAVFSAIAIRHASTLGYLSGRHALSLIAVAVPWASAGIWAWVEGFPARRGISIERGRRLGYAGLTALAVVGITAQAKAGHPSRWGYHAAGIWLADRAKPGEAVLDTRGWASFVSEVKSYDYWHVKQALSDRNLRYVVVGTDELKADSRRAATLRAMLAHAGHPAATFSGRRDGRGSGVEVYRFDPPRSWEGVQP